MYIVGNKEVLVADILAMLRSKNTCNSGKYSLALTLYNTEICSFWVSLKLGSLKGLERKWISSVCDTLRI